MKETGWFRCPKCSLVFDFPAHKPACPRCDTRCSAIDAVLDPMHPANILKEDVPREIFACPPIRRRVRYYHS